VAEPAPLSLGVPAAKTGYPVTVQSTWLGKMANRIQAAIVYSALVTRPASARHWRSWALALGSLLAVSGQAVRLWRPRA